MKVKAQRLTHPHTMLTAPPQTEQLFDAIRWSSGGTLPRTHTPPRDLPERSKVGLRRSRSEVLLRFT